MRWIISLGCMVIALLIAGGSMGYEVGEKQLIGVQDLFFDNFESYDNGTFPSSGGWVVKNWGNGEENQTITDKVSCYGLKSFQLWGNEGWPGAVVYRNISAIRNYDIIGFEVNVMVWEYPSTTSAESAVVAFYNFSSPNVESSPVIVFRSADHCIYTGKIYSWWNWSAMENLGKWHPKVWYKFTLIYDRPKECFDVYINDTLVLNDYPAPAGWQISAIKLASGQAGVKCYFDNIRVFAVIQGGTVYEYIPIIIAVATISTIILLRIRKEK